MAVSHEELKKQLSTARLELRNLRKDLDTLRRIHKKDIENIKTLVRKHERAVPDVQASNYSKEADNGVLSSGKQPLSGQMKPIGYVESVFQFKNGTPRQGGVCQGSQGRITIDKSIFNNPEHSLQGLEQFSYVWIIFIFHKNNNTYTKAKVKPPRLNGAKIGLFSTRCPYRPNPIGLTLAKLDRIEGTTVHVSGIDIIDGTPVLDIKPYIPEYDQPFLLPAQKGVCTAECSDIAQAPHDHSSEKSTEQLPEDLAEGCPKKVEFTHQEPHPEYTCSGMSVSAEFVSKDEVHIFSDTNLTANEQETKIANWIEQPPISKLRVCFTSTAEAQIHLFGEDASDLQYQLKMTKSSTELRSCIVSVLEEDPRSPYRRHHCTDRLHYFSYDCAHVTCWYDGDTAEVLSVKPMQKSLTS